MNLIGNFYFEKEKITFLFVISDFGKKNMYIQFENKMYDLRYFLNKFEDKKIFFLIKMYFENQIFEKHIKSVIEGSENKKRFFKFFQLIIEIELINTNFPFVISKIIELSPDFDEQKNSFLIYGILANKIIFKYENSDKIDIFYKKCKIELGYCNSEFNKLLNLLGTYINLQKGYKILEISEILNVNCFDFRKEKTMENFIENGFFIRNNGKIIKNSEKEIIIKKLEEKFFGILENKIIEKLF